MSAPAVPVRLQRLAAADTPALAAFAHRVFRETYAALPQQDLYAAYAAEALSPAAFARHLAAGDVLVGAALGDGTRVGYVQVRRSGEPPAPVAAPAAEIARLYVDRPWHGRGVADALMGAALDVARDLGAATAWLSVQEDNARALAYYRKRGFVEVGRVPFDLMGVVEHDHLLARPLDAPGAAA